MHPTSVHAHPHPQHNLAGLRHSHAFSGRGAERRGRALAGVAAVTLATMVLELVAGYATGSLALVADGWHMGSHAVALGGAWLAGTLARRAHERARYAFGGWKIEVLAGYTSAIALVAVALWIGVDAVLRLLHPEGVAFEEALTVAVIGLVVNLLSVWLLARAGVEHGHAHDHGHDHAAVHDHDHDHDHDDHAHQPAHAASAPAARATTAHHDHNFRAAYLHVLADALTSVMAIAALAAGLIWGWTWADAVVGLAGAVVIAHWAVGLLRESAAALVDATADTTLREAVRAAIESDGDAQVADLHVWQVGPQAYAAALTVMADRPLDAATYRERLQRLHALQHVTVEVHGCPGCR